MLLNFDDAYPLLPINRPLLSPFYVGVKCGIMSRDGLTRFSWADLPDEEILNDIFVHNNFSRVTQVQDVLNVMAENGMLVEESVGGCVSGVKICHDIFHEINAEMRKCYVEKNFTHQLIHCKTDRPHIVEWLKRCFLYTLSAKNHIVGVVLHRDLNRHQRAFWKVFLDDEKHHWKIYDAIFRYLDIDMYQLKSDPGNEYVRRFVRFLFNAGQRSPYEYGALLFMMEMPPTSDRIEDDPQFGVLIREYGFPKSVVMPLWRHACYNGTEEHSQIWFRVLRSRNDYLFDEYKTILESCRTHCKLAALWNIIEV